MRPETRKPSAKQMPNVFSVERADVDFRLQGSES